ncbi:MAG: 16S rRNA (cytosine(1402)-N(4))-methyltransferase RsmH [bacterium]|nr:16S rRNA (cytosine(1402)-N(4))-methyltransferase RsmH [bacterium]
MHTPVLLQQVIENLDIQTNGLYIDATLGEGGYTREIIEHGGKVLAIDADINQISNFTSLKNIQLVHGNFADIETIAKNNHFYPVDGIAFDLGLSMEQLNTSKRGFSYKKLMEPLDMRLDVENEVTAGEFINYSTQQELYELFARNSEEINSQAIAEAIVAKRKIRKLQTVGDLMQVLNKVTGEPNAQVNKRIFQALRIAVNEEFVNLSKGLEGSLKLIKDEGKIIVVTFHSLEDRIVKRFIKTHGCHELKKSIKGRRDVSYERSATLRVFSK